MSPSLAVPCSYPFPLYFCIAGYLLRFCFVRAAPEMISVCEDLKRNDAVTQKQHSAFLSVGYKALHKDGECLCYGQELMLKLLLSQA